MSSVLTVLGSGEAPEPFIGPAVARPLLLLTKSIRSEEAYDEDPDAYIRGVELIRRATDCVAGRPYVFVTSARPGLRSRVRSKKGLLWDHRDMKSLEALHGELEWDNNYTSLTSLVSLEGYEFTDSKTFITNWTRSVLLVSDLSIVQLFPITQRWVREKVQGTVALDFNQMFADLEHYPGTVALRYFVADNGGDESFAIVGHEEILDASTIDCLNRLG